MGTPANGVTTFLVVSGLSISLFDSTCWGQFSFKGMNHSMKINEDCLNENEKKTIQLEITRTQAPASIPYVWQRLRQAEEPEKLYSG